MLVKVLKSFRFALDGITAHDAAIGDIVDVRPADGPGLIAAGFAAAVEADAPAEVVEAVEAVEVVEPAVDDGTKAEPAIDLDAMKRAELDAFAAELGLDVSDAGNKGEVKAAIEAELARRAATPETPEA